MPQKQIQNYFSIFQEKKNESLAVWGTYVLIQRITGINENLSVDLDGLSIRMFTSALNENEKGITSVNRS